MPDFRSGMVIVHKRFEFEMRVVTVGEITRGKLTDQELCNADKMRIGASYGEYENVACPPKKMKLILAIP